MRAGSLSVVVAAPVCVVLLGSCSGSRTTAVDDINPVIVAPGVVSTEAPEFAVGTTPDGRGLYFDRASPDRRTLTIMYSALESGRWSTPVVAPFSGTYRDVDPFVTPDGRRLYFSSNRPRAGAPEGGLHTWYVDRGPDGWGNPVEAGSPLNSDSNDVFVSADRHGTLVFGSTRDGRPRIYTAAMADGRWTAPRALPLDSEAISNPAIAPSGRFILFAKPVPGRGTDIFVSCRDGAAWQPPMALPAPVNSRYADFAPFVDASETTLYFTSERPGIVGAQPDSIRPPGDLYRLALRRAGLPCRR